MYPIHHDGLKTMRSHGEDKNVARSAKAREMIGEGWRKWRSRETVGLYLVEKVRWWLSFHEANDVCQERFVTIEKLADTAVLSNW